MMSSMLVRARRRAADEVMKTRYGYRLGRAVLFDQGASWQASEESKRKHLYRLLQERGHRVFVEAGTWRGDTVEFFVGRADTIISVELDEDLAAYATRRFTGERSVQIIRGDATIEIPRIVGACTSAPLVYLDSHCSGAGTSMGDELEPAPSVLELLGPVAPGGTTMVVDDLRLFGALPEFPGLDTLTTAATRAFPAAIVRVGLDSLVIET
jgi:hypothetical protein